MSILDDNVKFPSLLSPFPLCIFSFFVQCTNKKLELPKEKVCNERKNSFRSWLSK